MESSMRCVILFSSCAAIALVACALGASVADRQPKPEPTTQAPQTNPKFSFRPGKPVPGYTQVSPGAAYTKERGYGFDLGSKVAAIDRGGDGLRGGFCTSAKPFFFSIALPEGNYDVTVTLGDAKGEGTATVKAES